MVNGQEYNWAGLHARLDQFIALSQRISVDNLIGQERLQASIEELPERIAGAMAAGAPAAQPAPASNLSGWTELVKSLADLLYRCIPVLLLLLLAAGYLPVGSLDQFPLGLLR